MVVLARIGSITIGTCTYDPIYAHCQWSLGIIRGVLFLVAGHLFIFEIKNNFSDYGDGSLGFSVSTILPFETYIHLGLFALCCVSLFTKTNVLTFAMVKAATLYFGVFSLFELIVSVYFSNFYFNKHYKTYELDHKHIFKTKFQSIIRFYNEYPVLLVPILTNIILLIASMIAFSTVNYVRNVTCERILTEQQKTASSKSKNNNNNNNNNISRNLTYEETDETISLVRNERDESNNTNITSNTNNNSRSDSSKREFGFYSTNSFIINADAKNGRAVYKYLNLLYFLIICQCVWFVIYCMLLAFHHCWLLEKSRVDESIFASDSIINNLNSKFSFLGVDWSLWSDIAINDVNIDTIEEFMEFRDWIVGYTKSFTFTLHRGFMVCIQYKLLYANKWKNDISILLAATMLLVPLTLNIGFLLSILVHATMHGSGEISENNYIVPLVSLILILIDLTLELFVFYDLYCLWSLIDSNSKFEPFTNKPRNLDVTELTPRLQIWDMATIDANIWCALQPNLKSKVDIILNNQYYGKMIMVSIVCLFICMVFIENMICISVSVFYGMDDSFGMNGAFAFTQFNTICVWGAHLGVMWCYGFSLSHYTSKRFNINKKPFSNTIAVTLMLITLVLPLIVCFYFQVYLILSF